MDKLQVVKCNCGDDGCQTYQLNNMGYFAQGSGFDIVEAQTICDAVNNTVGKGINPNAVAGLLEALVKIRNSIKNQQLEDRFGPTLERAEEAINSAELK